MKKILVPTDYSTCAANAMRYAIQLARRSGLSPVFMHVVTTMRNLPEFVKNDLPEYESLFKQEEAKLQKHVLQQYGRLGIKERNPRIVVKMAATFSASLLETMNELKPALIVMGTHGITNLKTRIFGTHTEHVIAASPAPVLSIPCPAKYEHVKELVYYSDLNKVYPELTQVRKYARLLKANVSVVHFDYGWAKTDEELKLMKKLSTALTFRNIRVTINESLLSHIRRHHRNKQALVCLVHDKKGVLEKFFTGSNPEEAPSRLHRPVLSFQRQG